MEIDHVLFAVDDLPVAAQAMEARHGLSSIEGGRHPGWGTANRIVPLGDTYLELVTVVDQTEAAQSRFGSWVASATGTLAGPFAWAVRTHRLEDVAHRLGLTVSAGSRVDRSGRPLRWRLAGVEHAAQESALPFFIEWEEGAAPRSRRPLNSSSARCGRRAPTRRTPCRSCARCSSSVCPCISVSRRRATRTRRTPGSTAARS